jgi:hypothetical protein
MTKFIVLRSSTSRRPLMKRILLIPVFLIALDQAKAQGEFAASAFYNEFKKVYHDAQSGFTVCKGDMRKTGIQDLVTEYKIKCILPLSDSAKIVEQANGKTFVIYYFEPDKMRLKVDQRAVDLRDAITTAFGKPLYVRSETTIVNKQPFSSSMYYDDPTMNSAALFQHLVYYQEGRFYLSLEIRGRRQ